MVTLKCLYMYTNISFIIVSNLNLGNSNLILSVQAAGLGQKKTSFDYR